MAPDAKLPSHFDPSAYLLVCWLLVLFGASSVPVSAKKPDVKSDVAKTTISGYAQVQFRATNQDDVTPDTAFLIRRGRFRLEADLTDLLALRLSLGLTTDKVDVRRLFLRYKVHPRLMLKAGQLKKPFSFSRLQLARRLLLIERPRHVQEDFSPYLGRDIGLLAEWEVHKRVNLAVGAFNGTGIGEDAGSDNNSGKDMVARMDFTPIKPLTLAFNVSLHGLTPQETNRLVPGERVTAYGADVYFHRRGIKLVAEVLYGTLPEVGTDSKMVGLYLTAVHKQEIKARWLVAIEHGFRIEWADGNRNVSHDAVVAVTPYVGFYLHDNARLQITPVLQFPQQGDSILELITQAQMEF